MPARTTTSTERWAESSRSDARSTTWALEIGLPALLVFAFGCAVVWMRPAIPVDEVRYLEVLRELHGRNPLLLTLNGEPYADKPPLMFWIGLLFERLGLSTEAALRVQPALSSGLVVVLAGAFGRRVRAPGAAWMQALLLLPLSFSGILLFDPLLACAIWASAWAWGRGSRGWALAAAAAAFLAKGPVAALVLLPLWIALDPRRGRLVLRALGWMLLALLPLAAWALAAAAIGGPAFREELLWHQTADRMGAQAAHARAPWFYVPVLLAGLLPAWPVLANLGAARACLDPLLKRVLLAAACSLGCFLAVAGKQAHYLLPLVPAVALLAAALLEQGRGARALRVGLLLQLGLLAAGLALGWASVSGVGPFPLAKYGSYVQELGASQAWKLGVLAGLAACGWAVLRVLRVPASAGARTCLPVLLACCLALLPVQVAAGSLLLPRHIESRLVAEPRRPLVVLGSLQAGLYHWIGGRTRVLAVRDTQALTRALAAQPDAFVIMSAEDWKRRPHPALEVVVEDLVRGLPTVLASGARYASRGPAPR